MVLTLVDNKVVEDNLALTQVLLEEKDVHTIIRNPVIYMYGNKTFELRFKQGLLIQRVTWKASMECITGKEDYVIYPILQSKDIKECFIRSYNTTHIQENNIICLEVIYYNVPQSVDEEFTRYRIKLPSEYGLWLSAAKLRYLWIERYLYGKKSRLNVIPSKKRDMLSIGSYLCDVRQEIRLNEVCNHCYAATIIVDNLCIGASNEDKHNINKCAICNSKLMYSTNK